MPFSYYYTQEILRDGDGVNFPKKGDKLKMQYVEYRFMLFSMIVIFAIPSQRLCSRNIILVVTLCYC
jgi:hypothetical protein